MYIIYRITNKLNNKTYIGKHKVKSVLIDDGYMGSGVIVNRAFDKYGIENFSKGIITSCVDNFEANVLEKYYIAKEKPEYNITDGGDGGHTNGTWRKGHKPTKGCSGMHWKLSDETKHNQSKSWYEGHPNASFYSSLSGKKNKGKHWYNNGIIQVTAFECPEDFKPGMLHKPGEWLERDLETGRFMKKRG